MRPIKLTMQAFGPYAGREEIDFATINKGLFLVCGPTGSGKTTIFDAIKFALYGVTSAEIRTAREMRSSHADPDTPTSIDLVFEHAGCEYRVHREPAQLRPKRRGSGMRETAPEAYLEDVTNAVSLASKDSDVTSCIMDMLGIDADQFSRIVMIAQNDFADVLNAKTKEREALFRKIFGTGVFAQAQELLETRRRELEMALELERGRLNDEIARMQAPTDEHLHARYDELMSSADRFLYARQASELLDALLESEQASLDACESQLTEVRASIGKLDEELGQARVLVQARANRQAALDWLAEHAQDIMDALGKRDELETLQPKRDELRASISNLTASLPEYSKLETEKSALADAERMWEANAADLEQIEGDISANTMKLSAFEEEQAGLLDVELKISQLETQSDRVRTAREELDEISSLKDKFAHAKSGLANAQDALVEAEDLLARGNGRLLEAQRLYNADKAGMLAEGLVTGQPCPVCGSREHPHPASSAQGAPREAELDELEREVMSLRNTRDAAAATAASARAVFEVASQSLEQRARALLDVDSRGIDDALRARFAELDDRKLAIGRELDACKKDAKRKQWLAGQIAALRKKIKGLEAKREDLTSACKQAEFQRIQARANLDALKAGLAHDSEQSARDQLADLKAKLACMQREFDDAQKSASELTQQQAQKTAEVNAADDTLASAPVLDVEALRAKRNDLVEREAALGSRKTSAGFLISNHRSCKKAIEQAIESMGGLEEQYASLDLMARIATGKTAGNLGKVAFETYVQGAYFDRVLVAANERLGLMSASRYSLLRREAAKDRRFAAGLEIDVLDRYTGDLRPAHTLSGGETFLASLSLALGLSDVIMAQAGGMHVDAMFVDEGFGSLDDETCQLAIDVLDTLSSDDRMIGIISHVDELKDRIATQIRVTKTRNGSTLKLET